MRLAFDNLRHTFRMMTWSWQFVRSWRIRYFLYSFISVLQNAWLSVTSAYLIGQTTYHAARGDFSGMLDTICIVAMIVIPGIVIISIISYWTSRIQALGLAQIRKSIFAKLCAISAAGANRHSSGDLTTRLSMDAERTAAFFGPMMTGDRSLFSLPASILITSVICIVVQPVIGSISLVLVFISIYVNLACIRREYRFHIRRMSIMSSLTQRMIDTIEGSVIVRLFGLTTRMKEQYERESEASYTCAMGGARFNALRSSASSALQWSAIIFTLLAGSIFVHSGWTDLGTVVFIVLLQSQMNNDVLLLTNSYHQLQHATVAATRVKDVMDGEEEQRREQQTVPDIDSEYAIELRDVTLRYGSHIPVINKLSLQVRHGEKLAIVGSSGGGKSTLIRYLMELVEAEEGDMILFGRPRELYSREAVRELFAYVPQNGYIFDGTIRENIAWGNRQATEEDIMRALRETGLEPFVEGLPEGLDTRVGEHGGQVSGGQRQRIAIARAMVKDAPLLLLDEATSALDGEAEELVQQALERLMEGRTVIMIAHRLSTVRHADRMIVMENGNIVEEGTHEQLLACSGRYAYLYRLQYA